MCGSLKATQIKQKFKFICGFIQFLKFYVFSTLAECHLFSFSPFPRSNFFLINDTKTFLLDFLWRNFYAHIMRIYEILIFRQIFYNIFFSLSFLQTFFGTRQEQRHSSSGMSSSKEDI